ncbi:two-component regulator propeller domain-containing protein [Plebeiibacterium marinum]|uniref:Uncharacterized protein n=1 Tax=Plebeiibacterium marinum TaxID=2992111 RepID=A0AAE3MCQ6_9BACT|nr:two-component regulator propeller domain-containing protein [Plebeiobacterium marinum]MCW3805363.1 hypothetical protein [Plebeiobacterium marinum]
MKIYFALLVFSIVFSIRASAQYSVSSLSTLEGLSQNEVTSIIQDEYGFLWFKQV